MRKSFSTELLTEIRIKLDKKGLEELDEKEVMVLHQESLQEAIEDSTALLGAKIDNTTKQLGTKIDNVGTKIDNATEQLSAKIDGAVKERGAKIDHAIEPVHQELAKLRFWTKIIAGGIWAVAASLIASLILKLLIG